MTYPSEGPIYYMTVAVSYVRSRREIDTKTWVISRLTDPVDIMMYDDQTMKRLSRKYYKKSKAKHKPVTLNEVLTQKIIGTPKPKDE